MAIKNVVAQNQRSQVNTQKIRTNQEGLGQPIRARLHRILQLDPPPTAIPKHLLETRRILRGGNDQDLPDPGQQQRAKRVIDHRLVIDRQQLLRDRQRRRMKPSPGSTSQNYTFTPFHDCSRFETAITSPSACRFAPALPTSTTAETAS